MSAEPGATTQRTIAAVFLVASVVFAAACDSGSNDAGSKPNTDASSSPRHAVGAVTASFVDRSRPTPRSRDSPPRPERTLKTRIFYPAVGPPNAAAVTSEAEPDRDDGPYPLIVFSHGLGAGPEVYRELLISWAAAGYVVAAPYFPLTSTETPGSTDAGDVANQPGDVSFVITKMLAASTRGTGTFAGLIDRKAIGAAGHSNGAITTLGLVANTCCRDDRVAAAVVLAGNPGAFAGGAYDYTDAPPMFLAHGTADTFAPYDGAVDLFNVARGPKALLTVDEGDHGSWLGAPNEAFASVLRASTDFFASYLAGDDAARARIANRGEPGVTSIRFVPDAGSKTTIPAVNDAGSSAADATIRVPITLAP